MSLAALLVVMTGCAMIKAQVNSAHNITPTNTPQTVVVRFLDEGKERNLQGARVLQLVEAKFAEKGFRPVASIRDAQMIALVDYAIDYSLAEEYERILTIDVYLTEFDRSMGEKKIAEISVTSEGSNKNVYEVVPSLIEAAFAEFPESRFVNRTVKMRMVK